MCHGMYGKKVVRGGLLGDAVIADNLLLGEFKNEASAEIRRGCPVRRSVAAVVAEAEVTVVRSRSVISVVLLLGEQEEVDDRLRDVLGKPGSAHPVGVPILVALGIEFEDALPEDAVDQRLMRVGSILETIGFPFREFRIRFAVRHAMASTGVNRLHIFHRLLPVGITGSGGQVRRRLGGNQIHLRKTKDVEVSAAGIGVIGRIKILPEKGSISAL